MSDGGESTSNVTGALLSGTMRTSSGARNLGAGGTVISLRPGLPPRPYSSLGGRLFLRFLSFRAIRCALVHLQRRCRYAGSLMTNSPIVTSAARAPRISKTTAVHLSLEGMCRPHADCRRSPGDSIPRPLPAAMRLAEKRGKTTHRRVRIGGEDSDGSTTIDARFPAKNGQKSD